jgi:hypothetical protein
MKRTKGKIISLELTSSEAAVLLAQKIADACGSTVTVSYASGETVGSTHPERYDANRRTLTIDEIQQMAHAVDAKFKN